jgi:cobyrinic acid a,c-diamide synthase
LAYAQDRAFGFYYQEDLDTLRDQGVRLLPLDTLKDTRLPECDGLVLGGGFPEMFIEQLEANASLRADIRSAVEAGLPTYAECGGLMYLSKSLRWDGRQGEMVGVVPGDVVMGSRPVGRGYATLEETGQALWPARGQPIPAHEFHYSHLENLPAGLKYAYRVLRGQGIDGSQDGFVHKNLLAAYCHRRGSGDAGWIAPFLSKVGEYAETRKAARLAA